MLATDIVEAISEAEVREALARLDPLWKELFPAEQARVVQQLVERVHISTEGAEIRLRTDGLTNLVADLRAGPILSMRGGLRDGCCFEIGLERTQHDRAGPAR